MANEKRLIDANALLEKADWYEEYNDITGEEIAFKYVFASDVEDAPTVDAVEVVHAKAVPIYSNIRYEDTLIRMDSQCPLCGALMLRVDAYCPNCGAKMDGDGNG